MKQEASLHVTSDDFELILSCLNCMVLAEEQIQAEIKSTAAVRETINEVKILINKLEGFMQAARKMQKQN